MAKITKLSNGGELYESDKNISQVEFKRLLKLKAFW